MKFAVLVTIAVITLILGGAWLGYNIQTPPKISDNTVWMSHGGVYPMEAYLQVNSEVDAKAREIIGESDRYVYIVAVVPQSSGYRVRIMGEQRSKIWKEGAQNKLNEWIKVRMDQIQDENFKARQDVPYNR